MSRSKLHSWIAGIAGKIARFLLKIKKFLRSKPVTSGTPGTLNSGTNNLDDDLSYEEYAGKIAGLDDVIVTLGIHKRSSASHKYMYEMGRRDGSLGVVLHNLVEIARANARELFRHIYVILKGKLAALKAGYDAAAIVKEYDETLYKREQAYYDYVKYQYRFFPRSHSFFLFLLYLVFAVALIIADMPLALTLIQNGFNLAGGADRETFPFLFKDNFWQIIAANWETTITAVGIALCTIYIKIYYDEFVGTPYANKLMTFKRFLIENGIEHLEDTEINIKKEHNKKEKWKTGLFIFTIASIVILAIFRLQTTIAINEAFTINFFSGAAFIAITILFPLIGGICLSYSLNNIQNLTRLWAAKGKCKKSRRKWIRSVRAFTIAEKNYNDLIAADRRLGDEERLVEEYKAYLIAFYERGYAIGGMQPEKYTRGEDFFTKILEWRNIAISRKINNHIGNLN